MSTAHEALRVERALLGRILDGTYPPDLRLPAETELSTEFGCGRSTVREALSRLSAQGLVSSRRGSGAKVTDYRRSGTLTLLPAYLAQPAAPEALGKTLLELLNVRTLLAREAARLAARYASASGIADARAKLDALPAKLDPTEHALAELDFFHALLVASEVWPAVWLANSFFGPMREVNAMLAPAAGGPPKGHQRALERLLELVEAGEEQAAADHIETFFQANDRRLQQTLSGAIGAPPSGKSAKARRPRATGGANHSKTRKDSRS